MATQPKNNTQTITVKTHEDNPEPLELIAQSIITVADAFDKINHSSLTRRCILVLLKDLTGVSMNNIEKILDSSEKLRSHYIKAIPKK